MKIAEFGGYNSDNYSLDTVIGWLQSIIEEEAELCENSSSIHRKARLDRAYDGLRALEEASDWSPMLTKEYACKKDAKTTQSICDDSLRKP